MNNIIPSSIGTMNSSNFKNGNNRCNIDCYNKTYNNPITLNFYKFEIKPNEQYDEREAFLRGYRFALTKEVEILKNKLKELKENASSGSSNISSKNNENQGKNRIIINYGRNSGNGAPSYIIRTEGNCKFTSIERKNGKYCLKFSHK